MPSRNESTGSPRANVFAGSDSRPSSAVAGPGAPTAPKFAGWNAAPGPARSGIWRLAAVAAVVVLVLTVVVGHRPFEGTNDKPDKPAVSTRRPSRESHRSPHVARSELRVPKPEGRRAPREPWKKRQSKRRRPSKPAKRHALPSGPVAPTPVLPRSPQAPAAPGRRPRPTSSLLPEFM